MQSAAPNPEHPAALPSAGLVSLYRHMVRLRALDLRLVELQREGTIPYFTSSTGEEGAICAAAASLREQDWLFPSARDYGAALVRGMPVASLVQQMFGTSEDAAKGRQMPNLITARAVRVASVSGAIGAQIPHAVGVAWAAKIKKEDSVALALFGDGATSTGDFHAGLNFAGVMKAPVVFVCRNNGFSASLPTARQTKVRDLADKAIAYGIPGMTVDGSEPSLVLSAVTEAVLRAARGDGPTLIEVVISRDPTKDPIATLRRKLEQEGLLEDEADLARDAAKEIEDAVLLAKSTPPPSATSLFYDVYEAVPPHLREQRDRAEKG